MAGIGLTMEAIAQNPVIYELMMTHAWRDSVIDLDRWLPAYARNRYGVGSPEADSAWMVLRHTVYNGEKIRDGAESIITARPTLDSQAVWTRTTLNYNPADLLPAWDLLIKAAPACSASEGFRYDLVDVTRQVLANYALPLQQGWVAAYRHGDSATFERKAALYLDLISDLDTLLRTQRDFLLGPWLADARAWGKTAQEKALYERNARDLLTLWGGAESPLHEYANRQWSGLLNDFYRQRWVQYFQFLRAHSPLELPAFEPQIRAWEWDWVNRQQAYPTEPQGDPVATAQRLYEKYRVACGKTE
jgi:alpha-N-acetylglucosaminidase